MRGIIIGCICMGGIAWVGSGWFGPDIERVAHRPPSVIYDTFDRTLPDLREVAGGELAEVGLGHGGLVSADVDRIPNRAIKYRLLFTAGRSITLDLRFKPLDGGKHTRITADIDVDKGDGSADDLSRSLPMRALGLKLAVGMMVGKLAAMAERGDTPPPRFSLAELRGANPAYQQSQVRRHMAQAAAPMTTARPMNDARPMVDLGRHRYR